MPGVAYRYSGRVFNLLGIVRTATLDVPVRCSISVAQIGVLGLDTTSGTKVCPLATTSCGIALLGRRASRHRRFEDVLPLLADANTRAL